MSGTCLAAFILALVLSVLAILTLWVGMALPLVLGGYALATVDGTRFRGRALAGWAVVISLMVGGLGFAGTRAINRAADHLANGVVAALRSERAAEERRALLDGWMLPHAERAQALERVDARYRGAVERLGAVKGGPILPSLLSGQFPLMLPPQSVVALDAPDAVGTVPSPGAALWVRVPFERAVAHLALFIGDGSQEGMTRALAELTTDGPAAVLRDARFFVARRDLGSAPGPR